MEETSELDLGPTLWGAHVTEAEPVPLESGERRLTVFRATLEKGNKAQIFLSIKGEKYALGTLIKDKKEYTRLDFEVFEGSEDPYEISILGDGTVALVGSYSPSLYNDSEDEFGSFDSDDDLELEEEDDEIPGKPSPKANVAGAKPALAKPAAGGAKPVGGAAKTSPVGGAKTAATGAKPAAGGAKPPAGKPAPAKTAAKPAQPKANQSPKPATPAAVKVAVTVETPVKEEKIEETVAVTDAMEEEKASTPEKKTPPAKGSAKKAAPKTPAAKPAAAKQTPQNKSPGAKPASPAANQAKRTTTNSTGPANKKQKK